MQRLVLASLAIALPLLLFLAFAVVTSVRDPQDAVVHELGLSWVVRMTGAYVAGISAIALLVLALIRSPGDRMLIFVFSLFAGLLVFQAHWATAVSFAAILIATLAKDFFVAIRTSRPSDPGSAMQ